MILRRIKLSHYRGIESREISLGSGVTIVEGPNEAGKSSLVEALGLVFAYKDDSKAAPIKAISPVHRDESPEIEVELTSGPYHFVYRKRFGRGARTELELMRPKRESLTGREAHERAEAILAETLDAELWKALQIVQGEKLEQASFRDSRVLQKALDAAAGGTGARDEDAALFTRVEQEHGRYFTPGGRKGKELAEAEGRVAPLRAELEDLEAKYRTLESDVEECERLEARRRLLEEQLPGLEVEAKRLEQERGEVERRRAAMETAQAQALSARLQAEVAEGAASERRQQAEAAEAKKRALIALEESSASEDVPIDAAQRVLDAALSREAAEKAALEVTEQLQSLRAEDFQFHQDDLFRAQLAERQARVECSQEILRSARKLLAAHRVSDAEVKELQESEFALRQARERLEEGGPSLELRALRDLSLMVDAAPLALRAGETQSLAVADRSIVSLPGSFEIEVRAGRSTEALQRASADAVASRDALHARLGVVSLAEGIDANETRKRAERDAAQAEQRIREDLRDLTPDTLRERLDRLTVRIDEYRMRRATEPELPADVDAAKVLQEEATAAQRAVRETYDAAHAEVEGARHQHVALKDERIRLETRLETARVQLRHEQERLEIARATVTDEALVAATEQAAQGVAEAAKRQEEVRLGLAALNPERVEALARAALAELGNAKDERRELGEQLGKRRGRLEALEEVGLFEALERARSELEQSEHHAATLVRRAGAAQLLFETLRSHRDATRRAYVEPLARQIDRLGCIVFEPSFEVSLGDDLAIESCTRSGRTIPFESLSKGTQEQLGLLARIAVALSVARDEGVPLLLDDTLGHSDPERLRSMAAMLTRAGEECQIIVLTCSPERFRAVAGAHVERIERG